MQFGETGSRSESIRSSACDSGQLAVPVYVRSSAADEAGYEPSVDDDRELYEAVESMYVFSPASARSAIWPRACRPISAPYCGRGSRTASTARCSTTSRTRSRSRGSRRSTSRAWTSCIRRCSNRCCSTSFSGSARSFTTRRSSVHRSSSGRTRCGASFQRDRPAVSGRRW